MFVTYHRSAWTEGVDYDGVHLRRVCVLLVSEYPHSPGGHQAADAVVMTQLIGRANRGEQSRDNVVLLHLPRRDRVLYLALGPRYLTWWLSMGLAE